MSRQILIIDDEAAILTSLTGVLQDDGYVVTTANSGNEGLDKIEILHPDLVLLDIWMPGRDGLETLQEIKKRWPSLIVIMMSGHGTIDTAVRATKYGAYDFVEKPISLERLLLSIKNAFNTQALTQENLALKQRVKKDSAMIGESAPIRELKQLITQVAPTAASVLITGEHGTGKELVAHLLHTLSNRYNQPFIEINCAAIPEELIESELFGHEKGAFTGATQKRRGKFDLAHEGTLFLDEIADMSLRTQAKILRILQEQKFERVGGSETITVDVRIVAATNKDLKKEIQKGNFREDLFYRLNVVPFHVPPLRERASDIELLAEYFMIQSSRLYSKSPRNFTPDALRMLKTYSWPGNVREIKNLFERLMILTPASRNGTDFFAAEILEHLGTDLESTTTAPELTLHNESDHPARNLRDAREEFEKDYILKSLIENQGNVSKTAATLGVERSHLHRKIKSYGIEWEAGEIKK